MKHKKISEYDWLTEIALDRAGILARRAKADVRRAGRALEKAVAALVSADKDVNLAVDRVVDCFVDVRGRNNTRYAGFVRLPTIAHIRDRSYRPG